MVSLLGSESDTLIKGVGADQKLIKLGDIDCKILMLYVSSHSCAPCREFTPLLTELYQEMN